MKTTVNRALGGQSSDRDFRLFLQAELGRRCARNPRYSLRAFAKFVDLDHATLSQLLRGKRALTERMIRRLGFRLGVPPEALERYSAALPLPADISPLESKSASRSRLESDVVRLVSEWQHYAVLELIRLEGFRPDVHWIARVLDCPADEVTMVVDRLIRLGLLVMAARDRWVDAAGDTMTSLPEFAFGAIRKAAEGSHPGAAPLSSASATTIAVSTKRLAGAVQRIERFRQDLLAWLDADPVRDDVYRLEISLFPLTTLNHAEGDLHGLSGRAVADDQ